MSRDDTIHYTLQMDVADGKMPEFEALADEAIADVQANEPGTLVYRWDASGMSIRLHERFADEAAMMTHASGTAATEIFPKLMEISAVSSFDVHGNVSDDAKAALEGLGGTVFGDWKGFDR